MGNNVSSLNIGKREAGIILLTCYHYGIVNLLKKGKVKIPPLVVSVLGLTSALSIVKVVKGKLAADELVIFLDPAVSWLGEWMPLWLTPPLVALPNAIAKIKGTNTNMWIKLAIIHILCWILTVIGTSKFYRLCNTSEHKISKQAATNSKSENPDINHQRKIRQMRLVKYWGAIAAAFYAANAVGVNHAKPLAIAATSIFSLSAGNLLPVHTKKIIHPIFVSALISGIATILSYRASDPSISNSAALCNYFSSSTSALPSSSSSISNPPFIRPGDALYFMLGPSCTALAVRIYSLLPDIHQEVPSIVTSSIVASVASMLLSPLLGNLAKLPPEISAVLAHVRTIALLHFWFISDGA